MTDLDVIEDRLRRTFRVVADRPVAPAGAGTGPERPATGRLSSDRPFRMLVAAVAAVVIVAGFALALVYGPRKPSAPGPGRIPTATRPASGARSEVRLVYTPVASTTVAVRNQIAAALGARFRALGVRHLSESVSVTNDDIHVSGRFPPGQISRDLAEAGETDVVALRPVECASLPYVSSDGQGPTSTTAVLPPCSAPYVHIDPEKLGMTVLIPDPTFTPYPSTSPGKADADLNGTVLLPTDPTVGGSGRVVLGPSGPSGSAIASAHARLVGGKWTVDIAFTSSGAVAWDQFAHQNFHRVIGVVLDGKVLAAPEVEPSRKAFSSPGPMFQVADHLTSSQANTLVRLLGQRSLPVGVKLVSTTTLGPGVTSGHWRPMTLSGGH